MADRKQCPKCGYVRQPSDMAPDYECPNCGVVYAKVEAMMKKTEEPEDSPPPTPASAEDFDSPPPKQSRKLVMVVGITALVVCLLGGGAWWWFYGGGKPGPYDPLINRFGVENMNASCDEYFELLAIKVLRKSIENMLETQGKSVGVTKGQASELQTEAFVEAGEEYGMTFQPEEKTEEFIGRLYCQERRAGKIADVKKQYDQGKLNRICTEYRKSRGTKMFTKTAKRNFTYTSQSKYSDIFEVPSEGDVWDAMIEAALDIEKKHGLEARQVILVCD